MSGVLASQATNVWALLAAVPNASGSNTLNMTTSAPDTALLIEQPNRLFAKMGAKQSGERIIICRTSG